MYGITPFEKKLLICLTLFTILKITSLTERLFQAAELI